jgi:hypothetical protein
VRISIPREHGALLILGGAAVSSIAIAPQRGAALGLDVVIAASFLARGALERVAVGAPLRAWDRAWCAALGLAAAIGATRAPAAIAIGTVALGALALAGAMWARRARLQRSPYVEQLGLAALGASAALGAGAGGTSLPAAIALGAVLAAHAASAVPIVRAAVRGAVRPPGVAGAIAAIAIAAIACGMVSRPWAMLALGPRVVQLVALVGPPRANVAPAVIGVRETALLAVVIAGTVAACLAGP